MMIHFKSFLIVVCVTILFLHGTLLSGQNEMEEPWEIQMNAVQPPSEVMQAIGVKPGMTIGEIGAGILSSFRRKQDLPGKFLQMILMRHLWLT